MSAVADNSRHDALSDRTFPDGSFIPRSIGKISGRCRHECRLAGGTLHKIRAPHRNARWRAAVHARLYPERRFKDVAHYPDAHAIRVETLWNGQLHRVTFVLQDIAQGQIHSGDPGCARTV